MRIPPLKIDYSLKECLCGLKGCISSFDTLSNVNIFDTGHIYYSNSGRTSLYLILKALNLKNGSRIGTPLYVCSSVFDAINEAGYVPFFIDISLDTYTLDPLDLQSKINNIDALIVVHTFGHPAEMDKIIEIARGIPIIEDCAHSLLSRYKKIQTGEMGDMSFFSFRSGKYISAYEGGMILVNNTEFLDKINKEYSHLKNPSIYSEIKGPLLSYGKCILNNKLIFENITFPVISFLNKTKGKMVYKHTIKKEKIRKSDLIIFLNKIKELPKNVSVQRANSKYLLQNITRLDIKTLKEKDWAYSNYFNFPVRFENYKKMKKAYTYFLKNGLNSFRVHHVSLQIAKLRFNYVNNSCPNTEIAVNTVLIIPNYYTLTKKDLDIIIYNLNSVSLE
ncbi:MAG: DegT/DnrJ/EryC1/StrS family aminotransferase [Candidatus Methanoperedens sp.]|nr:DegT/DnrJ/EryC1/StrS family aminotransferase [Candidatus Methanoperedens sp.]